MSDEPKTTTSDFWKGLWKDGNTGWHRNEVNAFLIKYFDELTGGRSNLRFFVPLSGKSADMLWLADKGHTVVGVELAKQANECFFAENNLTFTVEIIEISAVSEPVEVYKCKEKRITIFSCDLFAVTENDVGGKFDAIWDRGSLVAVAPSFGDRGKRYTTKMRSLLASDGNYLLESCYYEVDRGMNPPASITDEQINDMYEEDFTIKKLEMNKIQANPEEESSFAFDINYYLFKPKGN